MGWLGEPTFLLSMNSQTEYAVTVDKGGLSKSYGRLGLTETHDAKLTIRV